MAVAHCLSICVKVMESDLLLSKTSMNWKKQPIIKKTYHRYTYNNNIPKFTLTKKCKIVEEAERTNNILGNAESTSVTLVLIKATIAIRCDTKIQTSIIKKIWNPRDFEHFWMKFERKLSVMLSEVVGAQKIEASGEFDGY